MASRKIQLPAIGGLRKVIKTGGDNTANPGTTIREFANQIITLGQLKAALGLTPQILTPSPGGGGISASLSLGPGLSGGGSLVGVVPINLTVPLALIPEDAGQDDYVPTPGPQGPRGLQGLPGVALVAEVESEDSMLPPPITPPRRSILSANWPTPGSPNVVYAYCPMRASIMAVRLMTSGGPGSCAVDIWKAPFGSFPPLVGGSIVAGAAPTIAAGISYVDTTLTGWTRNINAGDVLAFVLTSSSTFTQVHVSLEVQE